MKSTLRPTDRLRQRPGIEMRALPQGALLVDLETGKIFRLNRVGAEIWAQLSTPVAPTDVYAAIAARYQLPATQAESEVGELLGQLVAVALVDVVAGAA